MASKFRNPSMKKSYEQSMSDAELGVYGTPDSPTRGAGHRAAFWDGYTGIENRKYPTDSISYAYFRAGQDFKIKQQRTEK